MELFFIPDIAPENYEVELERIAELVSLHEGRTVPVPTPHERVRLVEFKHGEELLTAEVGRELKGVTEPGTVRGKPVGRRSSHSYTVKALAIFPGDPLLVHTDGGNSGWSNPIRAACTDVKRIEQFDPPSGN